MRRLSAVATTTFYFCIVPSTSYASLRCGSVNGLGGVSAQEITATRLDCSTARRVTQTWMLHPRLRAINGFRFRESGRFKIIFSHGQSRIVFLLSGLD